MSPLAAAGWRAELELQFQADGGQTGLASKSHAGPLLVQRQFYPKPTTLSDTGSDEPCHAYIVHPPGGVVCGDELRIDVQAQPRAHALLTTPAAGKFYRRGEDRVAVLAQTLHVNGGVLEWLPQENIYYPDSPVRMHTEVRMTGG